MGKRPCRRLPGDFTDVHTVTHIHTLAKTQIHVCTHTFSVSHTHTHTHTPVKPRNPSTGDLGRKIHLEMFGKEMSAQFYLNSTLT